ncbi:SAM-dependent methyltransferase [Streptomyces sp. Ru87]|uniref:SAM-dependent methyltransferase n=1 Tax=Streptomyces sp. Ru87 TaxID=2044307 RepID=UPI00211D4B63|nr:SAM-dependent methyltransferase [Streptomyces sp. Ru87]
MAENMSWTQQDPGFSPPEIDTTRPSVARVYDAVLGGKDNYPVDRELTEQLMAAFPDGGRGAVINRAMLGRAVRHMSGAGIDQFLDLGSGLPTVQNTHEIAQSANPRAKVVYVDNDPIVLAHGNALLADNRSTAVVAGDLREPERIFAHSGVSDALDLRRPVGVIMNAVIQHVLDEEDPVGIIGRYKEMMAPGSYLLLTHFCSSTPEARRLESVLLQALGRGQLRSMAQIAGFFEGLEITEPGVVYLPYWRPDEPVAAPLDISGLLYGGGLGRKPGGEG